MKHWLGEDGPERVWLPPGSIVTPSRGGNTMRCRRCETDIDERFVAAHVLEHVLRLEQTMSEFASDQAHLDADVAAENAALTDIESEIAALKAQPGAESLDFTALDAAAARLQTDDAANAQAAPPADGSVELGTDGQPIPAPAPDGTPQEDLPTVPASAAGTPDIPATFTEVPEPGSGEPGAPPAPATPIA